MIALVISLILIFISPFIYLTALQFKKVWAAIEKITNFAVTALVVLHMLPESIVILGWSAILFAFAGLFLPPALEHLWEKGAEQVHLASIVMSLLGLIVHGLMDGAALATPVTANKTLALAVVLHTLPAGILICSIFYPRSQKYVPPVLLATLALSTVTGFFLGGQLFSLQKHADYLAMFQAFVAGSLLHISFDRHDTHTHHHDH